MRLRSLAAFVLTFALAPAAHAYEKAVEGTDVVKDKLFPKKGKIELDGKFGYVLNGSYVQTYLLNAGITYYWSETWGFNLEGSYAINSDKDERKCIESFYNDPNFALNVPCQFQGGAPSDDPAKDANYGPGYVPVRQLQYIGTANFIWNPIYGKQLVLLSFTTYFDLFLTFGGGLAISQYYPERLNFPDGHPQRGTFCTKKQQAANPPCDPKNNPGTLDTNLISVGGRPAALAENNIALHFAIGQRFHFLKSYELLASLEDYTLVGTEQSFDTYLTLFGGIGVRF